MPSVLSLFSGIGGLDLGLEAYGYETVAYSEIDQYASAVMSKRFPGAKNLGDISGLDFEVNPNGTTYIERSDGDGFWLPPIDIICGGFPCQDISSAWAGPGIEGSRSGLWKFFARAIRDLRPRGVIVENVANLASRGIDIVLGDLAACGYDAEWGVLRASDFGALHERARMFIVAYPNVPGREEQRGGVAASSELASAERDGSFLAGSGSSSASSVETESWSASCVAAWPPEPGVGRVVDGIPRRVDRLRCLGNAVVPQVAEHVAGVLHERISGAAHA
jgi:DNA (cytosine-5)-methyltransferase 1